MSGGVDSAVAALLLKEAGHAVEGLFMSNWEDDEDAYCTTASDWQDARRVCDTLQIPLHRASFAGEYRERVFTHFLREYAAGRTPNPDVLCNREIKFGVCLDYMHRLGAAKIATGHYARVERAAATLGADATPDADATPGADAIPSTPASGCDQAIPRIETLPGADAVARASANRDAGPGGGAVRLFKAADRSKDQSYFLHGVAPTALADTLFPLGGLRKQEVRARAHAAGLSVSDKPDSTGICFIGERPFQEFLSRYLKTSAGPIEDASGRTLGEHRGLALYTIGQRSGIGLGGRAGAAEAPWYVAEKDTDRNALIVVQDHDHPLLMSDSFIVEDMHWLVAPDGAVRECSVKTRYRQSDLPCRVRPERAGRWHVTLSAPARAVTPGQYAVFYADDLCLGGGVIAERHALGAATRSIERSLSYNSLISAEGS
jgi:tRNA-specific 2-thiouridylase